MPPVSVKVITAIQQYLTELRAAFFPPEERLPYIYETRRRSEDIRISGRYGAGDVLKGLLSDAVDFAQDPGDVRSGLYYVLDPMMTVVVLPVLGSVAIGVVVDWLTGSVALAAATVVVAAVATIGAQFALAVERAWRRAETGTFPQYGGLVSAGTRVATVPNGITLVRVPLTVFVVYLLQAGMLGAAGWAILLVGASDWLDGFVARRFGQRSLLGAWLDASVDRLFVIAIVIHSITVSGFVPDAIAVALLLRELIALAGVRIVFPLGAAPDPSTLGKVAFSVEIAAFTVACWSQLSEVDIAQEVALGMALASAVVAWASLLAYGTAWWVQRSQP